MKRLFLIIPVLLLFSCTVQKRHYSKGFFVSWQKSPVKRNAELASRPVPAHLPAEQGKALTVEKKTTASQTEDQLPPLATAGPGDSCDVLLYKNGSETRVKILEVTEKQVKYKRCDMPEGPQYVCDKTDLFKIIYSNGTFEVVKVKEKAPEPSKNDPYSEWQAQKDRPKYQPKNTRLATTSLIFAILGFYPAIFIGGIAGIITAIIQLNRIQLNPERYGGEKKTMVALGLAIGSLVFWTLIFVLFIFAL